MNDRAEIAKNICDMFNIKWNDSSNVAYLNGEEVTLETLRKMFDRHGKWKWDTRFHDYVCSECGNWDMKAPNYCSNCGARMDL